MATTGRIMFWSLILSLTIAGSASAFDGRRTGFCLGFGAGVSRAGSGESNDALTGVQSTLDMGGGFSDQLLILYSGHSTFYRHRNTNVVWLIPTVVARYYFKPAVQSFYVFGGPAVTAGVAWDNSEAGAGYGGFGVTAGGGYQGSRHFQAELGGVRTSRYSSSFISAHATVSLVLF